MSAEDTLMRVLRQHQFVLIRQNGHRVYRNPDGITHVVPCSISDSARGYQNNLHQLIRKLVSGESSHYQRRQVITKEDRDRAEQALRGRI